MKVPSTFPVSFLLSLSLVFLCACGAGGGGAASSGSNAGNGTTSSTGAGTTTTVGDPSSSGTDLTPVPPAGTLQISVDLPSYREGTIGLSAFDALNAARRAAGAGLLAQNAQLDSAAAAHATYLTTNIQTVGIVDVEDPSRPDYDEATPASRIVKAGYPVVAGTELVGSAGSSRQGADCIRNELNAVYHAAGLLRDVVDVGFGFGTDALGYPLCVIEVARKSGAGGQVPGSGAVVAYPYDGQTNVLDTFFVGLETPRAPASLFPNLVAGTPVIVGIRNADFVNSRIAGTLDPAVTQFTLADAGGNIVPAGILAATGVRGGAGVALTSDANLLDGYVALVPFSPLTKGVTYRVAFAATLNAAGAAVARTWSFTTNP